MAAGDQQPTAPRGGGALSSLPPWALPAAGVAVGVFLWSRHKRGTASAGEGTTAVDPSSIGPAPIDPTTGNIINPATGQPYVNNVPAQSTQTLPQWANAAIAALKSHGYAPWLVQDAIYKYTHGQKLTHQEAGAVANASNYIGNAPLNLPYNWTPEFPTDAYGNAIKPKPKPVVKPPIIVRKPGPRLVGPPVKVH